MLKGLEEIIERTEEIDAIQNGNRIRKLYLRDRESAVLRFISEKDDVILAYMHRMKQESAGGKSKTRWYYCVKGDGQECPHCVDGNKPKGMLYMWTWVYYVLHTRQNPALEQDSDAPRWQPTKVGTQTFYKEDINAPLVFSIGIGKSGVYKNKIISLQQEYGSLGDRDYKLVRTGAELDTVYELIPKDPSKKSKEVVVTTIESLPPLVDYITGKNFVMSTEAADESSEDEPF